MRACVRACVRVCVCVCVCVFTRTRKSVQARSSTCLCVRGVDLIAWVYAHICTAPHLLSKTPAAACHTLPAAPHPSPQPSTDLEERSADARPHGHHKRLHLDGHLPATGQAVLVSRNVAAGWRELALRSASDAIRAANTIGCIGVSVSRLHFAGRVYVCACVI